MLSSPRARPAWPAAAGRVWLVCLFLLTCFLAPAPAQAAGAGLRLNIEDAEGGILHSSPARDGDSFAIRYLHSVALSPVTDYFIIKDGEIWLDRTVYQDFGAGLPHQPEAGQSMTSHNGQLTISGYNRRLGSFQLRVGRVAGHVLLLMPDAHGRQVEIPLDSLAEPGSAVTIAVRKQP